uniref:methylated-DNA--[protein]-cysteine S-methyltransferase n=1 Tax=Candidatus Kentrum sp. DK TaxID=2126562 RepID=A0A450S4H1_9GAMM|nr:MAG: O-6-methylguanine DNA methyltransferase [Candidatus Kentron sp. DK]
MNHKTIRETPLGRVTIIRTEIDGAPRITRILLPNRMASPGRQRRIANARSGDPRESPASPPFPDACPNPRASSHAEIDAVIAGIVAMLQGERRTLPLDSLDLGACSQFQRRVLRATCEIPWGRVSTYRLVARHLSGKPDGARAVGNALASNPFPLIIPCHRVIRSDGALGGYGGGWEMKYALLRGEGVSFDEAGTVPDPCYAFP